MERLDNTILVGQKDYFSDYKFDKYFAFLLLVIC